MPSLDGIKTNLFVNDTMFYFTNMGKHHAVLKFQVHIDYDYLNSTSEELALTHLKRKPFSSVIDLTII